MEINKRILVIEDDEMSASFLKEVLEIYGYEVIVAYNGKLGLNYFEANPFPVIISDLEMPIMGGKELIIKLSEEKIPPIIIVQTAHNEADTVVDIMKMGVYDYLIKPVHVKDLVEKVAGAFELYKQRLA